MEDERRKEGSLIDAYEDYSNLSLERQLYLRNSFRREREEARRKNDIETASDLSIRISTLERLPAVARYMVEQDSDAVSLLGRLDVPFGTEYRVFSKMDPNAKKYFTLYENARLISFDEKFGRINLTPEGRKFLQNIGD